MPTIEEAGYKKRPGKKLDQSIFKDAPPNAKSAEPTYTGDHIVFYDEHENKLRTLAVNNGFVNYGSIDRK